MVKTLWVLHLPKKVQVSVKKGDKVSSNEQLARAGETVFRSPAKGEVVEVGKRKIKLRFEAKKLAGTGAGKNHCWGELVLLSEVSFLSLNDSYQEKIVFVNQISPLFLAKAAALGIGGIVCHSLREELGEGACLIPILIVEKNEEVESFLTQGEGLRCLLDISNGCLLIPS